MEGFTASRYYRSPINKKWMLINLSVGHAISATSMWQRGGNFNSYLAHTWACLILPKHTQVWAKYAVFSQYFISPEHTWHQPTILCYPWVLNAFLARAWKESMTDSWCHARTGFFPLLRLGISLIPFLSNKTRPKKGRSFGTLIWSQLRFAIQFATTSNSTTFCP